MLLNIKNWKGQTVYIIIVRLILANILKSVVLLLCSMPPRYPLAFFLFCNYFRHIPTSNLCTCLSFGQYAFLVNVQVADDFLSFNSQPLCHLFRVLCWPHYPKSLPQSHSVTGQYLYPSEHLLISEVTFLKSLVTYLYLSLIQSSQYGRHPQD